VLLQNLDLLAAGDVQKLSRLCGCDAETIARHFRTIRGLNPKPGAGFSAANPTHLREPDLLARPLKDGRWQVGLNRSSLPSVEVDGAARGGEPALGAARALSHMVKARNETLLQVGREIVARQQAALVQGTGALAPMRMADLAEALGLHVSTISRVVAGAAIDAPAGVLWLRQMFSGARQTAGETDEAPRSSAAALRHQLGRIIAAEARSAPLSDAALAERLAEETGVRLARRTIAQYREAEGIPPAHRRRRPLAGKARGR
jgi:RNA polymerase sigma-54 factor